MTRPYSPSPARLLWLLLALPVALLVVLPAGPSWADGEDAEAALWDGRENRREAADMLEEVFSADEARQAEIVRFLDSLGGLRTRDARKYEKDLIKELAKQRARSNSNKLAAPDCSFTHESLTGKVYIQGATNGAKRPLLIALHGGGDGVGDGKNSMNIWRGWAAYGIIIAPTAPELRATAWNHADIEQYVIALIEAAKNTWDIDTNRIYVAGHSMGGFGTWSIGCKHADRFAAISPNAGGVFMNPRNTEAEGIADGHVPNLLNTPIWFYHSTDDNRVGPANDQAANRYLKKLKEKGFPYEFVYKEYTDRGHGFPADGHGPILKWLSEHTRTAYPKWFVWEPSRGHKQLFNWVSCTNTEARYGSTGRIEGKIEGNEVRLTTTGGVGEITVWLNEHLVDLDKPVRIVLNGEIKYDGMVYPRLSVMAKSLAETRDPEQFYSAAVNLSGRTSLGPAPGPQAGDPSAGNGNNGNDPSAGGSDPSSGPDDPSVQPAEPEPEPAEDKYPKGTDEFDTFMGLAGQILPAGHHILRNAESVSHAIREMNENYRDKLRRLSDAMASRVRGDERKLLREFSEMLEQ